MKQLYKFPALHKASFLITILVLCLITANTYAQCIHFKKLAKGPDAIHCLGIAKDGTLWAWGENQFGQVGNNSLTDASEPIQVSTSGGWKEVANGNGHSLAIDSKGKLWGWGRDGDGELGDGAPLNGNHNVLAPEHITSDDSIWKTIAASGAHSIGITTDGKLWVWGYDILFGGSYNTPHQVGNDTDWTAITTGDLHFIAIKKDGTLWGWGRNGEGQAGDSTTLDNTYAPVRIDSSHAWTSISAGYDHTLALKNDGTLWCWGDNENGRLGLDTSVLAVHQPVQIGTKKWKAISGGLEHSLAIDINGRRWGWGQNGLGEYGNDSSTVNGSFYSTVPIFTDSTSNWTDVVAAYDFSLNLTTDGSAWGSGTNDFADLGDGTYTTSFTLVRVGMPNPYPALATTSSSDVEYQRGFSYYATDCSNLIAEVFKTGANPIHANTTAKVWIDNVVKDDGAGKPYVQRHYEIQPANNDTNATGTVYLYFTQDEFTAYNASANVVNGTYPMLPVDSTDGGHTGNLRIERILTTSNDGSGTLNSYKGTSNLITPSSGNIFINPVQWLNGRWQVELLNITGFGGFFATTGATLLPVTWLAVNGSLNYNDQAIINWKVNEFNVLKYDVEKSSDGISFNSIATIASKGNDVNNYQYTDNLKVTNSLFYRIKQTDKDGKTGYSSVIALNKVSNAGLSVYPNPARDYVYISGVEQNKTCQIIISDMQGKIVFRKDVTVLENKIAVNGFNKGVYIIMVLTGNSNIALKFIKQ